jgi:hypothetical protein
MAYFSDLKKKRNLNTCYNTMNFEDIKLSEINQKQKEKYYLTPFM